LQRDVDHPSEHSEWLAEKSDKKSIASSGQEDKVEEVNHRAPLSKDAATEAKAEQMV
jgi:hypothetical protein